MKDCSCGSGSFTVERYDFFLAVFLQQGLNLLFGLFQGLLAGARQLDAPFFPPGPRAPAGIAQTAVFAVVFLPLL
jgi:hypothetical protein